MSWTLNDMPDMAGRLAVVTGANSGIGLGAAKALAENNAEVVLACRSEERANEAIKSIREVKRDANVRFMALDLTSLASVEKFGEAFCSEYDALDLLINNAGVMVPPLTRTEDGFELQFGVNFLSHFALTGHLLGRLENTQDSRVVTLSSIAHRSGRIQFGNLNAEKRYSRIGFYAQSKLACLVFTFELQRRLEQRGYQLQSLAAHPGVTATNLVKYVPLGSLLFNPFLQKADDGALPTLQAATDPTATGSEYFGPSGRREYRGPSTRVRYARKARDEATGKRLWDEAEKLTGVSYL